MDNKDKQIVLHALIINPDVWSYLDDSVARELERDGLFDVVSWSITELGRALANDTVMENSFAL